MRRNHTVGLAQRSPPHSQPTSIVLVRTLLEQAHALDAGFDPSVLAQMIGTIERFGNFEIPLTPEELPLVRAFFTQWARLQVAVPARYAVPEWKAAALTPLGR